MTVIERPFLATKSFNTSLVNFLQLCYFIVSNDHVCSFKDTISHVRGGCAPKMVLCAQNLVYEKLEFMKG